MSTQGKIKTLFSDKEKTEALFPRTKISAVSDENGKGLNAILDDMAYVGDITEDVASTPVNADLLGGRPAGEYATQNYVANEIAKAQLSGDGVDLSGYATKDEMSAAVNGIDFPVDSVNGKTGVITLSASDVGAHPDTWLPTIADVGAAPAGYGLGEINGKVCYDPNTALEIGFYHLGGSSAVNVPGYFGYGTMLVERRASCICQTIKGMDGQHNLQIITRESRDAGKTWRDWEYVNPPMALGVEYRTTERHCGKVVYCKAINFGALPESTNKTVAHGITGKTHNLRFAIAANGSSRMLDVTGISDLLVDDTNIDIQTDRGLSYASVVFTLWYIKD